MKAKKFLKLLDEAAFRLNACKISLDKARSYAESEFKKVGKSLDELIPDFDSNFTNLNKACKKALNIPRIDMPVIEPSDIGKFQADIKKGRVDIFAPYAKGKLFAPKGLEKKPKEAAEWIELGFADGKRNDDVVLAKLTRIPANKLIPTQSQIWMENMIPNIIKFGVPKGGSPITETTIIASKEGYILDGHHRYGQAQLANPTLKMSILSVPIDIKTLVKIGRTYGNVLGNRQKA